MFEPINPDRYNIYELTRALDIAKSRVFMGSNAAFLGSLMCSMPMIWTDQVGTAATNGDFIWWAPKDFLECTEEERDATILHEIWHKAKLHVLTIGDRDHRVWNIACDIWINNMLENVHGYKLTGPMWIVDHQYDDWIEEDIYDDLVKRGFLNQISLEGIGLSGGGDLITNYNPGQVKDIPPPDPAKMVADVQQAVIEAEMHSEYGAGADLVAGIKTNLQQFLKPVVSWDIYLHRWLTEKLKKKTTWRRPNRRHQAIYMPSRFTDKGGLEHLMFFFDVSGSVSDTDAIRCGSEIKYVWDKYKPNKLTIVQFDDAITHVHTMERGDKMHEINIIGRGGTDLGPVREYILEHKPTAVVIFSDLFCYPMEALPEKEMIPLLWIAVGNTHAVIPHGEIVHIKA